MGCFGSNCSFHTRSFSRSWPIPEPISLGATRDAAPQKDPWPPSLLETDRGSNPRPPVQSRAPPSRRQQTSVLHAPYLELEISLIIPSPVLSRANRLEPRRDG